MQISVTLCDANLNSPFLSKIVFVCLFRYEALKDNEIIPFLKSIASCTESELQIENSDDEEPTIFDNEIPTVPIDINISFESSQDF